MGKAKLEEILGSALAGVDLSARQSNKFDRLLQMLAEHWGVEPTAIGVKALAAAKNFGNRISEATRAPIDFLVLLADEQVELRALARSFEARALARVPTVVGVRRGGVWEVDSIFLASDADNPFDFDGRVVLVDSREALEIDDRELKRIRASVMGLAGRPAVGRIDALAAEISGGQSTILVKHTTEIKNLANRIGEAIGQRPPFVLVQVPRELIDPARRVLEEMLSISPKTQAFIVSECLDCISIDPVESHDVPEAINDVALKDSFDPATLTAACGTESDAEQEYPGSVPSQSGVESDAALRYRQLERVRQLRRHLPLDGNADRLYEERQESSDRLAYETKTLAYVQRLLANRKRVIVVLTGNAGHGKTHLCRRLLEANGANSDVMERLCDDLVGGADWVVDGATLPVRIVKDLSEINPPEMGASRLEALIHQEHAHVIVCANEGRLRDVVSRSRTHLAHLLGALERGLDHGETSLPERGDVHVLNLNYQAASAGNGGFLKHVLDHFLNHESAWKVCRSCSAREDCPMLANRADLALSPAAQSKNPVHREALTELVRVAEEGGYILTFRETLKFVAYLITGGLSCSDVEELHRRRKLGELRAHRLLPLLFESRLSDDEAEILPLLNRLRRLDPAYVALRPVDERIHADLEEKGEFGVDIFGEASRELHRRADLQNEEADHREAVRRARREAWFEAAALTDNGVRRVDRLGFNYHHIFRSLHESPELSEVIKTIRSLVRGLHTIQGAVGVDSASSFHLVDPAFGRSGSHSAVIARSLRIRDLELWTESNWWKRTQPSGLPPVLEAVEWLDRRLVLVDSSELTVLLTLDLSAFEFVMSAGNGIVMRDFHSAERRRILRTLARQAELGRDSSDEIRVLVSRGEGRLTVERDDTILLERNS